MTISSEVLCIGAVIVRLSECRLPAGMIIPLTWGTLGCAVDMIIEVFVIVLATIALEVATPISCATDVCAGAMTEVLTDTVVSVALVNGINVLADADANMWAAAMTALGSMPMLSSSDKALASRWGASSCWTASV